MAHSNEKAVIRSLKNKPATWAVVGLSANSARAAYGVASALQSRYGKRIIPVHPSAATVHGEQGYPSLDAIPDGTVVDVVDCFVRSDLVGEVVDAAVANIERLGIGAIWLQLGVVDEDAAARARAAGLAVVMDTCPLIEWPLVTK